MSSVVLLSVLAITITSSRGTFASDATDPGSDQESAPTVPCENDLVEMTPAAYALRIHPAFKNFEFVGDRIALAREYGQPYVTAAELDVLDEAFEHVKQAGKGEYVARGRVAALLNSGEDNLIREFKLHADQVDADLRQNAAVALENGDLDHHAWLTELIARVAHYRKGISIERGAWYWQHARFEAAQPLERTSDIPPWIQELRQSIPKVAPRPTDGNFDFTMNLGAINLYLGQNALRFALQRAYRVAAPSNSALQWAERMAPAPNLNRALAMFLNPPRLLTGGALVGLEGPVMFDGAVTMVNVRFDPRLRYFTVRSGRDDGAASLYYQMMIGDDGTPHLLDDPPLSAEAASHRLDLTHFAY